MPFDASPEVNEVKTISLSDLSWRLRHPETWPKGFSWDYGSCSTCAMGLAIRLIHPQFDEYILNEWWDQKITRTVRTIVPDAKSMPLREFHNIFWWADSGPFGHLSAGSVTPDMIADAIDAYLARSPC